MLKAILQLRGRWQFLARDFPEDAERSRDEAES
jgi:hypothetical protein